MAQQTAYEAGDRVAWEYGSGSIGSGRGTGEVVKSGLNKFGYDDVMKVRSDSDGSVVHIRPKDTV